MDATTFIISDGLEDIVILMKKNIYDEAAARWCVAAMELPYDFTDLEALTLRTYIDRSPKGIK